MFCNNSNINVLYGKICQATWIDTSIWVKAIQNFRKIAFCQNRISESNGLQIHGRLTLFAGIQKVNYYTSFQHLLQFSPFKKCTNVWQALLKAQI